MSGKCSEASQPVIIKLVGEGQTTNAAAHLTSSGINCAVGKTWTWSNVDISDRGKFPTGTLTITADHSVSKVSPAKTYSAPSKTITVKRNPVVKITHRPAPDPDNSVLPVSAPHITNENMANYPLSGTCTEDGKNVEVTLSRGVKKKTQSTTPCTGSGTWSVESFDISGLDTGTVTITATHETTITNDDGSETFSATPATQNVNRLPYVTISARDDITVGNAGTFTVSGTCSENNQPVKVIVKVKGSADKFAETGANSVADIICAGNAWSWEVNLGNDRTLLPTGEVTITVDHSSCRKSVCQSKTAHYQKKTHCHY